MPVELLAILAIVLVALPVGLRRTRHERAATRAERER
jgi:hypothetical protein